MEAGIVHGGESTYPVVPLKFCRALLLKEDSGRNANCRNYPAVGIAPPYLTIQTMVEAVSVAREATNGESMQ